MYGTYLALLMGGLVITWAYKGMGATAAANSTPAFLSFQRQYLAVFLVMMAADWMQGPYVYKLYSYYGFSRHDNGVLFIAGFGSSLVFGTWAGPIADKYGRKLGCILYGITYTLSCLTKHFNNFSVLMVGRLLGGFATSILWSAFESWMVSEHNRAGHDPNLIGSTFSLMIALNGLVAIGAGFIAQWSVDFVGHPVAPFDVSALFLVVGTIFVAYAWRENYGDQSHDMLGQMRESIQKIRDDSKIIYVGLQQALFEGAMYTFVFMWTPTLEDGTEAIPHGLIFASFMVACSLGGTLFGILESSVKVHVILRYVFIVASTMMAVPMVTSNHTAIMGAFIAFEIAVGVFWPSIGTLRSRYLPEEQRATIINLFRVPLNAMVCLVLYFQGGMTIGYVFTICTVFHGLAALMAVLLDITLRSQTGSEHRETTELKPVGGH